LTRYSVGAGSPEPTVEGVSGSEDSEKEKGGPSATEMPSTPTLSAVRQLGRLTAGARNRLPDPKTSLDAGARRAGSHAGRLHRAWRRATR
jgi:hypothetical protein